MNDDIRYINVFSEVFHDCHDDEEDDDDDTGNDDNDQACGDNQGEPPI